MEVEKKIHYFSIPAGVITAILAACLLFPLAFIVASQFMSFHDHENTSGSSTQDVLAIEIIFLSAPFLASVSGGIICSSFSLNRKYIAALISGLIVTSICIFFDIHELLSFSRYNRLKLVTLIIAGFLTGAVLTRRKIKTTI